MLLLLQYLQTRNHCLAWYGPWGTLSKLVMYPSKTAIDMLAVCPGRCMCLATLREFTDGLGVWKAADEPSTLNSVRLQSTIPENMSDRSKSSFEDVGSSYLAAPMVRSDKKDSTYAGFEPTRVTPVDFESTALTARPICHR